jgi:hypothetical protein
MAKNARRCITKYLFQQFRNHSSRPQPNSVKTRFEKRIIEA